MPSRAFGAGDFLEAAGQNVHGPHALGLALLQDIGHQAARDRHHGEIHRLRHIAKARVTWQAGDVTIIRIHGIDGPVVLPAEQIVEDGVDEARIG